MKIMTLTKLTSPPHSSTPKTPRPGRSERKWPWIPWTNYWTIWSMIVVPLAFWTLRIVRSTGETSLCRRSASENRNLVFSSLRACALTKT